MSLVLASPMASERKKDSEMWGKEWCEGLDAFTQVINVNIISLQRALSSEPDLWLSWSGSKSSESNRPL